MEGKQVHGAKQRITLERHYKATAAELWDLWTTKDGIEEWWGPDGFSVTVHELELRVGGTFYYAMSATEGPQMRFGVGARFRLAARDRNLRASRGESLGDREANPARASGDDRHPAGQVVQVMELLAVHGTPSIWNNAVLL